MHKHIALALLSVVLSVTLSCAPPAIESKLSVRVDAAELPADGLTPAVVHVALDPPPAERVVVKLAVVLGALSQTAVALEAGKASVTLWPPLEADLGAQESIDVAVTAEAVLQEGQAPVVGSATVKIVAPPTGAPTLVMSAAEQLVRADGESPIVVNIVGRRLDPGTVVTLTTNVEVPGVPATITLGADSTAELTLDARTEAVAFDLTGTAEGALPYTLSLAFLADDAPAYDLTGTFAQIAYGVVEISGMGISPSPQVVSAPTISKVSIVQDETGFHTTFETCAVQMPIVCIALIGDAEPSTTTPGPGFLDAIPDSTMLVPIRGRELGSIFEPTEETLAEPLVVGADMEDPNGPLPDSENDPEVTDPDSDGNPGVSVTNSSLGSEQHIVYRTRTIKLRGVIESSDIVDGSEPGSLEASTETSILNADFLTSNFSPDVQGKPSTFRMVRVDGRTGDFSIANNDGVADDISCADVRQYLSDPSNVLAPPSSSSCAE